MHRMRVVVIIVAMVYLAIKDPAVEATSTTPFVSDTSKFPWFYLASSGDVRAAALPSPLAAGACNELSGLCVLNSVNAAALGPLDWSAKAQYNASGYDLGWDFLRVATNPTLTQANRAEAYHHAGYLEGFLTSRTIGYFNPEGAWGQVGGPKAQAWIAQHIAFMQAGYAANKRTSPFWHQVGALLAQVRGLADGYNAATGANVTFEDMFVLSFGPEVGDVQIAITMLRDVSPRTPRRNAMWWEHRRAGRLQMGSHCSALIKPTATDLFTAHDTWSGFPGMAHRTFKRYDFQTTVTLSGYPGSIVSGDDWYMTSHELAVQETTNEVFNTSLYVAVVPQTVSEFVRVMTANYVAATGREWADLFATLNSGTYNNQYMITDNKRYTPGEPIVNGTLWIAEQIPGYVGLGDVSDVLRTQGYWASYNVPYFKYIYDVSGYQQTKEQQGSFWSYTKYARPEIFRRNNTDVIDLASMMRMMRYNDFRVDPFSIIPNCTGATNGVCDPKHSSMLTIASRGDLMTVYNTTAENIAHYGPLYQLVAQGCFGAIDSKIAAWSQRKSLTAYVVNGPTNDQQPTFVWNEAAACAGQGPSKDSANMMNYPWVQFSF
mgnify:FL=1